MPKEESGCRHVPNCWEFNSCDEEICSKCPAYPDMGRECWKVTGTKCANGRYTKASLTEKIIHCRGNCEFYKTFLKDVSFFLT